MSIPSQFVLAGFTRCLQLCTVRKTKILYVGDESLSKKTKVVRPWFRYAEVTRVVVYHLALLD